MSEDDMDLLGPDGQPSTNRVDRDRRAPRFSWTPSYETTFFRSLCESVHLGLRENSSFKAEAWERAAAALQATHGAYPAKSHLINKSDNARKRFRLWRGLREDPEFLYNSVQKTVTATEEAWRTHIEREPLSRALRGRPFDHEEFMEILYPDVIGSGGAPKRIMKPRRRTDGAPSDEADMPGTGILNLQTQTILDSPIQQQRPLLSHTPTGSSSGSISTGQMGVVIPTQPTAASSSALTPPDDLPPPSQARKRRQESTAEAPPPSPPKRRRISITQQQSQAAMQLPLLEELLDALRTRVTPRWREQALDIFFREFSEEELDLQVKISENVLSNENKAMVFCKMPGRVRRHWVGKFREMHMLNKTS